MAKRRSPIRQKGKGNLLALGTCLLLQNKPASMCEAVKIDKSTVSNGMLSNLEAVRVYLYWLEAARKKYETLDPVGSVIEPLNPVTDLDGCKWGCGLKIPKLGIAQVGDWV